MADTANSNTAPRSLDSAPSSTDSTTPPQTPTWDDVDDNTRDVRQYLTVAAQTKGHYLVGVSPEDFLDAFLPWDVETSASYRKTPISEERLKELHGMASKEREKDMYSAFTSALQSWPIKEKKEANGANVIVTKFGEYRKPDTEYRGVAVDVGHYTEDSLPSENATVHRLMETNVVFKVSAEADPFVDPPETTESTGNGDTVGNATTDHDNVPTLENDWPGESKSELGKTTRGQIASYAGITMFLSYRKHFMSVVVFGKFARLIFWDRCGTIVSRRFDYQEGDGDRILFEFYLRFSQLTAEQRGHDPTVVEVAQDDPDVKAALVQFQKYDRDMWHCNAQMIPRKDENVPTDRFLRMTVKFGDSAARSFIIPAPILKDTCIFPFSTSTRRSLAYDCSFIPNPDKEQEQLRKSKHGSLLFMKDSWREVSPGARPEAEIYHILAEKKVPHVATMVLGGDVEGMRTKTQEPRFQRMAYPVIVDGIYFRTQNALQCHRLFLDTVARDLSAFGHCRVLVNCIADAMEAAQCAFDSAHILHRDISSGNIMITPAHEGLLIDWDLCIVLDSGAPTHRAERAGTWAFMSINLLKRGKEYLSLGHTLEDDRESAFWVLLYVALRYLKHDSYYTGRLALFNEQFVDDFGHLIGGDQKSLSLPLCARDDYTSTWLAKFEVPGLNDLLTDLAGLFLVRYRQPSVQCIERYEALLVKWGEPDVDHPAEIYKARLERRANPGWLYETLRHHATLIPLPARPLQVSPSCAASSSTKRRRLEEVTPAATGYDSHQNTAALSAPRLWSTEGKQNHEVIDLSRRLAGMGALPLHSQDEGDNLEPEPKRRKFGES